MGLNIIVGGIVNINLVGLRDVKKVHRKGNMKNREVANKITADNIFNNRL